MSISLAKCYRGNTAHFSAKRYVSLVITWFGLVLQFNPAPDRGQTIINKIRMDDMV